MNDELDDLKRDYRTISAPPHLATRIHASVADSRRRSGFLMPAAVTCAAIAVLVWMLPFATQVPADVSDVPAQPSMSTLAALKPAKPAVSSPSMAQLRSVSVPRMPVKPRLVAPSQPQTKIQIENEVLKEKNDAYI